MDLHLRRGRVDESRDVQETSRGRESRVEGDVQGTRVEGGRDESRARRPARRMCHTWRARPYQIWSAHPPSELARRGVGPCAAC
jgi:hypothetical protein